jgi:glyoxylate/hydroxypyruvate reductase
MSLLIAAQHRNMQPLIQAIHRIDPDIEIELWPEVKAPERVLFAVTWNHPRGIFRRFPNLKVISSLGAGVDHIFKDPDLPEQARITRIISPSLTSQMCDYVLMNILNLFRNTTAYHKQQMDGLWKAIPALDKSDITVGILGFGMLGSAVAVRLKENGFKVNGCSNSEKNIEGIRVFIKNELQVFLRSTNILVNLLPLTTSTEGILNLDLFKQLRQPAYLINAARGEHLVDEDLVYSLDTGLISYAILDVFSKEPLPESHLFWEHNKITITPHVASITNLEEAAGILVENYKRCLSGLSLVLEADVKKEY